MKEIKFYYVYLITNIILNKQYVGSRMCYDENEIYMGSSKYLNEDIKIYGKENFIKQIINKSYDNTKDMLKDESYYILKYNTLAPNGYNRFIPTQRLSFHMAGYKPTSAAINKSFKTKKANGSMAGKRNGMYGNDILKGERNGMYGKTCYSIWFKKFGKNTADQKLKEMREKMSGKIPWMKGKQTPDDVKLKISKANNKLSIEQKHEIYNFIINKPIEQSTASIIRILKEQYNVSKNTIYRAFDSISASISSS